MSFPSLKENLERLQSQIRKDLADSGVGPLRSSECAKMAQSLPLAHAMPSVNFIKLTADEKKIGCKLLSPAKLDEHGIRSLRRESAEAALGTTEFVFLYCGQVRYPETQVGFLFAPALEEMRRDECVASPFDSGALHRKATWPDTSETATAFLARHTLPVPAYREYLANRIQYLFAEPQHYVEQNRQPIRPDPIGLRPKPPVTANDPRLWTFEVRVQNEVDLSRAPLEALFYAARLTGERSVRDFLAAQNHRVHLEEVVSEDDGDFATLQRRCLDYLRKMGIIHLSSA